MIEKAAPCSATLNGFGVISPIHPLNWLRVLGLISLVTCGHGPSFNAGSRKVRTPGRDAEVGGAVGNLRVPEAAVEASLTLRT
jgi:hypothetical protein